MIDFTTLQGLTIPEGVVTQITDASGRVIWAAQSDEPIVLEVAKQTLTTYANETTYTDEQFVLLDIYPEKSNSTVEVTYGGLTKTLTFSGTNAQQVFFGTFNGVSDSVTTPTSGQLTIEGGCKNFAVGTYKTYNSTTSKTTTNYCSCITDVVEWGSITTIPSNAFNNCAGITSIALSNRITSIGTDAFSGCSNITAVYISSIVSWCGISFGNTVANPLSRGNGNLYIDGVLATTIVIPDEITTLKSHVFAGCSVSSVVFPNGLTSIGTYAFYGCSSLALTSLPSGLTSIGTYAFSGCSSLALTSLPNGLTSISRYAFYGCYSLALTSLPNGLTSIGDHAFASIGYNGKKASITLPATLQSIGAQAFTLLNNTTYLPGFDEYIILATTPPTLGGLIEPDPDGTGMVGYSDAIGYPNRIDRIIVPAGCGNTYKAAEGWSYYADIITEVS